MVRKPIVGGQFYPQKESDLISMIEGFIPKEISKISAKGIILPHAGYIYSGRVAVATVSKIIAKKRVIILGPNHTGYGKDFSLWREGFWEIPFGKIEIDKELANCILENAKVIEEDYLAHKFEHSIEVELPILYYFFKEFKFVPIVCSLADIETYREVATEVVIAIKKLRKDVLIVASTDLTHYEPDITARKKDLQVIDSIINLDVEDLLKKVNKENISMCGVAPVAIFIYCMNELNCKKAQVVLYQTSGETSGDYNSVVGYVGIIVS